MAIHVDTKDCTALSDSELSEMADLSASGSAGFDVGFVSKARDEWVLVTQVRGHDDALAGYSFCTLERIGGTPCVLIGLASIATSDGREAVLAAVLGDQLRRAVLAFPDEDVLVTTRLLGPAGYAAFADLEEVVPRADHKATGEERAWARRLAKRFGAEGKVNDRTSALEGPGEMPGVFDYEAPDAKAIDPVQATFFADLDPQRGDSLVVFGWAMAETLAPLATR